MQLQRLLKKDAIFVATVVFPDPVPPAIPIKKGFIKVCRERESDPYEVALTSF